eukprot:CAMPEP_0174368170 /NCGR_PEP_ID=MMETSP0811_2-20130205/88062_1 /TAXON_ID=73025 ORGANISM="Eutreptiella gymnastica-like, Strain CCMP1594" /NCGR_SAMPLE_ID=MMETSP0811_2 /ASSEMBLY_ACC=CAM_ASM_000667 /LENGTH=106 /DNA_ID=CAMNT_0015511405 /DNA_START=19 /DNA_END=339 /DNA_ORIENTATION=+
MGMHKARRCLAADAAVSFPGAPDEAWMWNKKPTDAHRELVPSSLWSHWLRAGDARPQERTPVGSEPWAKTAMCKADTATAVAKAEWVPSADHVWRNVLTRKAQGHL